MPTIPLLVIRPTGKADITGSSGSNFTVIACFYMQVTYDSLTRSLAKYSISTQRRRLTSVRSLSSYIWMLESLASQLTNADAFI